MRRSDSEENEHFLPQHGDEPCNCRQKRRPLLIHTIFFTLYVCFTALLLVLVQTRRGKDTLSTLTFTGEQLATRQQRFVLAEDSPYAGPPSVKIDEAWRDLLDHVNIRASNAELRSTNQTSITLPNEHSSLVWMEVSHQLHCVKYLRQWTYRQYYHPEVSSDEEPHWLLHTDHCLDLIRQALMCRADTSLMTFNWATGKKEPMLNLGSPEHVCVDWDGLMEKIQARRISDTTMAQLVNPDLETRDG